MIPPLILQCPSCRAKLADDGTTDALTSDGVLQCAGCGADYAVREGIPDLTPPGISDDPHWETWQKHLEAFQRRRDLRVSEPGNMANKLSISGSPQQRAFAEFTGIGAGITVDIGCGPGKFRRHLPGDVHYIGLDPIPIPAAADIDFIRGLAEYLPFTDGSVRDITVLSALDHFNDLPAFVAEARRVLEPEGHLHVVQQVHEPIWSIRGIAHTAKDAIEDRRTKHEADVPHHMTEFREPELRAVLEPAFTIERERIFSASRLAPRRWFLTLAPRA